MPSEISIRKDKNNTVFKNYCCGADDRSWWGKHLLHKQRTWASIPSTHLKSWVWLQAHAYKQMPGWDGGGGDKWIPRVCWPDCLAKQWAPHSAKDPVSECEVMIEKEPMSNSSLHRHWSEQVHPYAYNLSVCACLSSVGVCVCVHCTCMLIYFCKAKVGTPPIWG